MIIGMLPMALSAGQNAPLGRAVIGGLMCSTIATLVFVPVLFAIAHSKSSQKADLAESVPPATPQLQS
jgi:multidrug efflux pump subunit AcrB